MKYSICTLSISTLILVLAASPARAEDAQTKKPAPDFSFAEVDYFHRFTGANQHEYTPAGQEDLDAWIDMVTIITYPEVKDGEALAGTANAVLENYKEHSGRVLRTNSVPRTAEKPAEHFVSVIFGRPQFLEAVFARFFMHAGVGTAVIYSHRLYGKKGGVEMSPWLEKNGPSSEEQLMKWSSMPKLPVATEKATEKK